MANEGVATSVAPVRSSFDTRVAELGFILLLILILIGLTPFDARSTAAIKARDAASAGGDLIRQLSFLLTFGLIAYAAFRKRGIAAVTAIPLAVGLLLAWCLLSSLWSGEPAVVARRGMLAVIFTASVMMSVDTLGSARVIVLWRYVMGAIILGDIASSLLIHNAVHLPDDMEAGLAGAWRGLHSHKNAAGAVAATAAAMFFYFALETRRRSDILLCLASVGFLVMTRSKSSMGLLPVALLAGWLYRIAWRSKLDRSIAAIGAALVILLVCVTVAVQWDYLARFLEDPQQFTGRSAIWAAELAYIRDHPLFGAGFGTFGNTGMRSPIYPYVGAGWVSQIGEGHSGYLEMIVTIGGLGFIIGMTALVIQPFAQFWQSDRRDANFNAMLFTLFFFDILHNFMESDFIQVTAVQWGQILLIIALLKVSRREQRALAPP